MIPKLFIILLLFVAYVAIIALASYKLAKSKLSDGDKVYWIIAMVLLNLLAAIPFIIYHDYFLSPEKLIFMKKETTTFKNSRLSKILFVLSIIVFTYWGIGQNINVYRFAVVGAIYEILWVFMLIGLYGLPIIALIFLIKEKFSFRSLYLYIVLIGGFNILMFSIY